MPAKRRQGFLDVGRPTDDGAGLASGQSGSIGVMGSAILMFVWLVQKIPKRTTKSILSADANGVLLRFMR